MKYIKGKMKQLIYEGNNNYKVGLIKIKETNDEELTDFLNKSMTFTGYFAELNIDDTYILYGSLINNEKYGYQYKTIDYERQEIVGKDAVYEFLASPLVKGCGEKTAKDIVETLGEDALKKIKENYTNLLLVPKMTEKRALKIYDSIMKYQSTDEMIVKLKNYGFSINDALTIINKYGLDAVKMVEANPYILTELIDFDKLDRVYLNIGQSNDYIRLKATFIETIKRLEMSLGNTYFSLEEILDGLKKNFAIVVEEETLTDLIKTLKQNRYIIVEENRYYLAETYDMEFSIASNLNNIMNYPLKNIGDLDTLLKELEEKINVKYNQEQEIAIKTSLENKVTIITGGPGTGKTTIIKAITNLYIKKHNLKNDCIPNYIALLAPTGRAAKKLSEATSLPAQTIHRYLKWNKENNEFQVNELNKNIQKLIIVDEVSMIDTYLFDSLLKGINSSSQLVLVGDAFQLPSVGPGLILSDLIKANIFPFCPLETIYRQSSNSYIPYLAKEIKAKNLSPDFMSQKDDYNFLSASGQMIKELIRKICEMSKEKGLTDKDIQILAPMYKGENGIDNLNVILQSIFNPQSKDKKEIKLGEVIYREGDKVLQLVNDPDNGVFNGDIGYIKKIVSKSKMQKYDLIMIDFDGKIQEYKREDMISVKHAYAISIHKSQGSEFSHVIMPISKNYYKMLYNKLIYTGVSRAKKSLIIIGEATSFIMAINNDYANDRKTTLKTRLQA